MRDDRLPTGWVSTTLGECYKWSSGGTPLRSNSAYYGGEIPWAVIGDLPDGPISSTSTSITDAGLENSSAKWAEQGSLLVAMYGSIGKLGIARERITTNQAIAFTNPHPVLVSYLFWYLYYQRGQLHARGKGGTQRNISQTVIRSFPFVLAPLPEQHRIVAKLDELFSELDAGVAALERAQAKLKRYRASVLKAAVEGRLTEEWRRKNPPDETGAELLQRILVERRKRWEQEQLAKFTAKGQKPTKNWQQKYRDPVAPETGGLPELPDGWCWASFDSICHLQLGKMLSREARESTENRRPYLRNSNVRWFSVDLSYLKQMAFRDHELEKFSVRSGDLLICEGGEPGRCAIYTGSDHTLMYQKAIHRARPHLASVSMRFVQFCFAHQVSSGIGMPRYSETTIRHLTLEKLRAIPLPIAPLSEQDEMAGRATFQLNCLDNVQQVLDALPASHQTVRQSILKRAFEGELVPQDPRDEPASLLLGRIRVTREVQRPKKKSRHSKTPVQRIQDP